MVFPLGPQQACRSLSEQFEQKVTIPSLGKANSESYFKPHFPPGQIFEAVQKLQHPLLIE